MKPNPESPDFRRTIGARGAEMLQELFSLLPLDRAMPQLLPKGRTVDPEARGLTANFEGHAVLKAGLWLYVDELERSHEISQNLPSPLGSLWHAIMHRREGDFSNSKYWYRQAGTHPLPDFDPYAFVDEVAGRHPQNPPDLLDRQRAEWNAVWQRALKEAGMDSTMV